MINPTLSLLKYLSQQGFGTMSEDLYWEELELGKNGVAIVSIGTGTELHGRKTQQFELISRGNTKTSGYNKLAEICEHLNESLSVCSLPEVRTKAGGVVAEEIGNVTIYPLATITNSGTDSEGKTIWTTNGRIEY